MYNVSSYTDVASEIVDYLIQNLAGTLPPDLAVTAEGTAINVRQGQDSVNCMDLALVDPPEGIDEYAELVQIALDSIQTVVSRLTALPWPSAAGSMNSFNAYSTTRGDFIFAGYGTAEEPILGLPAFHLDT
jgi:hypothetical protein